MSERVFILRDNIVIPMPSGGFYIPLNDCDTHEKLLGWVLDISKKTGVTREALNQFMEIAYTHHALKRPVRS